MGADSFGTISKGKTAREAFNAAVEKARYDHGHSGYSGSIAEKTSFVVIPCPEGKQPRAYANALLDEGDPRIDDKWGPAGCIKVAEEKYYFFGWASS